MDEASRDIYSREGGVPTIPRETYEGIPTSQFFSRDEAVQGLIQKDSQLKDMYPMFSHMNRTSFITPKEARLMKLENECLFALKELCADDDEFTEDETIKFAAYNRHLDFAVNDNIEGRRAKLLLQQERTQRLLFEEPTQRRSRLGRLLGR